MPFRDKLKRALGGASDQSNGTKTSEKKEGEDDVYYKPNEIPPSRFKGPVAKEHKERLEAFSFVNNWRRRSRQSQYSPRGSKVPTRNNSTTSPPPIQKSKVDPQAQPGQVEETEGEGGNVANVGGSRHQSKEDPGNRRPAREPEDVSPGGTVNKDSSSSNPFTDAELTDAFKKANLKTEGGG